MPKTYSPARLRPAATTTTTTARRTRDGEQGVALVTMLLASTLLLAAGGALILTTAMSASTSFDASAEAQAYYGAEAGIQGVLRVLRGYTKPSPQFAADPNAAGGQVAPENKITFRKAVDTATSNLSGETSTTARLSRWLPYDYPASGTTDRVTVSPSPYSPLTGTAYSVQIFDVDNTQNIQYSTNGQFTCSGLTCTNSTNLVLRLGTATITYVEQVPTGVSATAPVANSPLGSFQVSGAVGLVVPSSTNFRLTINQVTPFPGTAVLDGTVAFDASGLHIDFQSDKRSVEGTLFTLPSTSLGLPNSSTTTLRSTITASEPRRLRIDSTGLGPRGSRKLLSAIVRRSDQSIQPPATIVIRGSDVQTQSMTFDLGSSNAKYYTGADNAGYETTKPTVAISSHDYSAANAGVTHGSTVNDPKLSYLDMDAPPAAAPTIPSAKTPDFLLSADAARTFLNELETTARASNTYVTSLSGYAGSTTQPTLTFVDGNCALDGGGGVLVVTGNLTLNGGANFQGIILVMGNGVVNRSGGGGATILGSWVVANLSRTGTGGFGAPSFNVNGGGSATFQFDSRLVNNAGNLLTHRVVSIVEN